MIDSSGVHAFRVWQEKTGMQWGQAVQDIGTTGSISSRLFKLQNEYGNEIRFSVVTLDELSSDTQLRSRELSEVRYDLIGAHYLATGTLPNGQF